MKEERGLYIQSILFLYICLGTNTSSFQEFACTEFKNVFNMLSLDLKKFLESPSDATHPF